MDLLEYLAETLHCDYISNLRYRTLQPSEVEILQRFPAEIFTLNQYTSAIRYMRGGIETTLPFTIEEARRQLIAAFPQSK